MTHGFLPLKESRALAPDGSSRKEHFSFSCQVHGGDGCLDKGCFPLFLGNRTIVCSVAMYAGSRDRSCVSALSIQRTKMLASAGSALILGISHQELRCHPVLAS